jgi:protein transport protein SEC31
VRGLDFNPVQNSLLASGAVGGEVYIWDLKDPTKPYTPTPGSTSSKLDEITSVAWNQQVQYVLAGASSTGYTVVWDLRGKREVVALAGGGRCGMSDIAWHPDNVSRPWRAWIAADTCAGYASGDVLGRRRLAHHHGLGS